MAREAYVPTNSGCCMGTNDEGFYDAGRRPIVNLADPLDPFDGATKDYVDFVTGAAAMIPVFAFNGPALGGDPGVGQFSVDKRSVAAVTLVSMAAVASDGIDVSAIIRNVLPGDVFTIRREVNPAEQAVRFRVTAPVSELPGYFTLPVSFVDQVGPSPAFVNGMRCVVRLVYSSESTRALMVQIAQQLKIAPARA